MRPTLSIENARVELKTTIWNIQNKYQLPSVIVDGILSDALAELRNNVKSEMLVEFSNELEELKAQKEEADKESNNGKC